MGFVIFLLVILFIFLIYKAIEWENKKKEVRVSTLKTKLNELTDFKPSKNVSCFLNTYIFSIDEENEKIAFISLTDKKVISFSDIIGVELIEDGNTISKKSTSRTIGGAIVGGVLTGGVGAIIGGLSGGSTQKNKVSSLSVKIHIRDLSNPSILIKCFDSRTMTTEAKASIETVGKMESYKYQLGKKNADEIKDLISVIIDRIDSKTSIENSNITNQQNNNSVADELLKLNDLKEKGIISEDEFTTQKNKILNK
jgi:uncharacterized membrane protein